MSLAMVKKSRLKSESTTRVNYPSRHLSNTVVPRRVIFIVVQFTVETSKANTSWERSLGLSFECSEQIATCISLPSGHANTATAARHATACHGFFPGPILMWKDHYQLGSLHNCVRDRGLQSPPGREGWKGKTGNNKPRPRGMSLDTKLLATVWDSESSTTASPIWGYGGGLINFNLAEAPSTSSVATFTIQLAAAKTTAGNTDASTGSNPSFSISTFVNNEVGTPLTWIIQPFESSSCGQRSAISCHLLSHKFDFPGSWLKSGLNKFIISLPFNAPVYVQYDALRLELRESEE
ncbi:hypothetical protein C8F04DRAFT_1192777 [Mycena alexandri]|uniref:Uncharacterized protein n=1 Tax=Mycena alexandri TaxID=1745969 RepID=A0AAD6SAK8_9AGAR|nr:hypothetical protein C8F04DRAFT_1192777 [Mycena alexandri]